MDQKSKPNSRVQRWLPWLVLMMILGIFAVAIGQIALRMRNDIRQQIVSRDGDVLHAMAMMQFGEVAAEMGEVVREPVDMIRVLLKASELQGVLAVRLFETNGNFFWSFPLEVTEGVLTYEDRVHVLRSEPVTRLIEKTTREDLFLVMPDDPLGSVEIPILEVNVPLQAEPGSEVLGVAQFVLEGDTIMREFVALDRNLLARAAAIFIAGSLLIGISFGWAFRRLQRSNKELAVRTQDLLRANEELALAARTSAIGSVAAHLIHGLKNPLSGLHQFVKGQGVGESGDSTVWEAAATSTHRMQQMVSEVVRVLREERTGMAYELSLLEFEELFRRRISPLADDASVDFQISRNAEARLNNLQANLLVLILGNLVQNAIQASPANGLVMLGIEQCDGGLEFRVIDQGLGLAEDIRKDLFTPCHSSKAGGTGIGLAISRQLAGHLGAELNLESSSERGSVFVLVLSRTANFTRSPLDNWESKS